MKDNEDAHLPSILLFIESARITAEDTLTGKVQISQLVFPVPPAATYSRVISFARCSR
jgi:hypothetical protein